MKYTSSDGEDKQIGLVGIIIFAIYIIAALFWYVSEENSEYYVAKATVTGYRDYNYHRGKSTTSYTHYYDCIFVDKDGKERTAYFGDYTSSREREYFANEKVTICYTEPFYNGKRVEIEGDSLQTILFIGLGGVVGEVLFLLVYLQEKAERKKAKSKVKSKRTKYK